MKKAASFALGCKVNQYESEAIAELFAEKGYEIVGIDEEADVYVINTCTAIVCLPLVRLLFFFLKHSFPPLNF